MECECSVCQKGWMGGGMCGQHHWMHVIIKILVAIFIVWCGVQFGELKSAIRAEYSNYGYGMMRSSSGERAQTYFVGPRMMQNWAYTTATPAPTPAPTTTTKK